MTIQQMEQNSKLLGCTSIFATIIWDLSISGPYIWTFAWV